MACSSGDASDGGSPPPVHIATSEIAGENAQSMVAAMSEKDFVADTLLCQMVLLCSLDLL